MFSQRPWEQRCRSQVHSSISVNKKRHTQRISVTWNSHEILAFCLLCPTLSVRKTVKGIHSVSWIPEGLLLQEEYTYGRTALKVQATAMILVFQKKDFRSTQNDLPDNWSHVSAGIHRANPRPAQQRQWAMSWQALSFTVHVGKRDWIISTDCPFNFTLVILNIIHLMYANSRETVILQSKWMSPSHLTPHMYAEPEQQKSYLLNGIQHKVGLIRYIPLRLHVPYNSYWTSFLKKDIKFSVNTLKWLNTFTPLCEIHFSPKKHIWAPTL